MVRTFSSELAGRIYFVSAIATNDMRILVDDSDREALNEVLAEVTVNSPVRVHAFSWLERQLLLALEVRGVPLFRVMQRIMSVYARRVNARRGSEGPIFRHPYRSILLEDPDAFLIGVASAHLSAVWEGLTDDPAMYRWTSHGAYLGRVNLPWLTTGAALELLSGGQTEAPEAYHALLQREQVEFERQRPWLFSGFRMARSNDKFYIWMKARLAGRQKPLSLDELIHAVAKYHQVDVAAIASRDRSERVSAARRAIVSLAVENRIASLSDVARRLKRSRSTVHEALETFQSRGSVKVSLQEILEGRGAPQLGGVRRRKPWKGRW